MSNIDYRKVADQVGGIAGFTLGLIELSLLLSDKGISTHNIGGQFLPDNNFLKVVVGLLFIGLSCNLCRNFAVAAYDTGSFVSSTSCRLYKAISRASNNQNKPATEEANVKVSPV